MQQSRPEARERFGGKLISAARIHVPPAGRDIGLDGFFVYEDVCICILYTALWWL